MELSNIQTMNVKEKVVKIVLTGGHAATVGIAVVEELQKRFKGSGVEISWIGSKKAIEGSNATTIEYKIYPDIGVKIYPIKAGKIQTKFTKYTILSILKIPVGFIQSLFILTKLSPDVVLSLGGYASFPVVFWAWIFRIPVILHEQTIVAGRASISSSFFSRKIALAREESMKFFPKEKCVITGNPVMSSIISVRSHTTYNIPHTILVMGGSRGSEFINEEIYKIIPELTQKYLLQKHKIIHITGESEYNKYKDYSNKNYEVVSFMDPREMYKYYSQADLIISRSGANTVSEIMVTGKPAILIPLPRTFMGEQVKNAQYAEKFGFAKVILETQVDPENLKEAINEMIQNKKSITNKMLDYKNLDVNAAKKLVDLLLDYV